MSELLEFFKKFENEDSSLDDFIEYDGTTWNYAVPLHFIEPTDKPLEMEI